MISWAICAPGHLEIHRKHKQQQQQRAKVRRLSDDFRGRGCYTEIFKKSFNIWHMPPCREARVPLLSAEPHLFTDMAFLRQPVMPIGDGRRGVLHRDLPPQRLSITWCAKAETVSAGKAVRGEPSFLGAAILVWCMATCTGLGCRSHVLQN